MMWVKFGICALLILFAGKRIARYADVIAWKTGLGGLWIGLILVAVATSLPELFTGIGSIVFIDAPDLTVGNLFGANSYNLLNIGFLDLLAKGSPLLSSLGPGQLLTAVFTLIPLLLATLGIILWKSGFHVWSVENVGFFSIAIVVSYCIITRVIYNLEKRKSAKKENINRPGNSSARYGDISLKKAYIHYGISAGVIILSGIWLAYIGKEISEIMGLSQSFVGSLFMGLATTLPEITVSVAALIIGAREIAVANMLGSNLFNIAIIFVNDVLYRKGPILGAVSPGHLRQAFSVMAMTAVVIIGMATKPKKSFLNISWYVPVIFIIFLLSAYFNFIAGG